MNLLKNVLARLFALWALVVFAVSLLVIALPIWIISNQSEPRRTRNIFKIFYPWMTSFFVFTGVRRIFKGKEHFKKGENYVVVCNHRSFMDVTLASTGIPSPNKTIAKIEMSRIPIFGLIYKSGSVLVDRKNPQSRKESYTKMREVLNMGLHMCIYPEGTRNKTAEPLQPFHDGAFKLAIDAEKAVIPTVILYTSKVLPRHKPFYFWPHPVEMHFLPPVASTGKTVQELKDEVFMLMKNYYVQHN